MSWVDAVSSVIKGIARTLRLHPGHLGREHARRGPLRPPSGPRRFHLCPGRSGELPAPGPRRPGLRQRRGQLLRPGAVYSHPQHPTHHPSSAHGLHCPGDILPTIRLPRHGLRRNRILRPIPEPALLGLVQMGLADKARLHPAKTPAPKPTDPSLCPMP
jgi:hypothetical protein